MTPSQRESAILVVSHAPVTLEQVVRVLEQDGFDVDVAADGAEGLAVFRTRHRLVIVDPDYSNDLSATNSVTLRYWPKYVLVRPVGT